MQASEWLELLRPYIKERMSNGEYLGHCIVHEDHNPSANYNLEEEIWFCYSCSEGGPLEKEYDRLFNRYENNYIPDWVGEGGEEFKVDADPLPSEEEIEEWHNDLLEDPHAMEYLMFNRGLRLSEIEKRKILLRPDRISGVKYGFPVYEGSKLVNIRWYAPKIPSKNQPKRIWSIKGRGKARLYPIDVISSAKEICIVEGEFDALLLNSWGIPAVTATVGAGASANKWKPEWSELFEDKVVYIIPDQDRPGVEYAYHVYKEINEYAMECTIVTLPYPIKDTGGADVSDYLLEGGQPELRISELRNLLQRSIKESKEELLRKDPEVRKRKYEIRRTEFARKELRREQILLNFTEPPYTHTLKEELEMALPPFTYTVERLHPKGSNSLLRSAYKAGKSTLLLNLMKSLVDGVPFLDTFEVERPIGRVAFWNYEVSRVQFARWARSIEIKNQDRCAVWNLRGYNLALDVDEIFEKAVDWLKEQEVECLIIDPYSRAYAGDENDNSQVGEWLDTIDRLKREAGVEDIFMSAHYGRGFEERARGAARLEDWADSLWSLNKDEGDRYFSADGRDVMVPESKLAFDPGDKRLFIVGGSRHEERIERIIEMASSIIESQPGQRTYTQIVDDLASLGTKAERQEAIERAMSEGIFHLDRSTRPARMYPGPE